MKERLSLVLVLNTPCLILILWLGAAFLQCDWYCIYVCLHIFIVCRHTKHMSIMAFYMVTSDMGSIRSEGSRSSWEMALASPYLGFHRSASCLMRRLCGGGWLIFINTLWFSTLKTRIQGRRQWRTFGRPRWWGRRSAPAAPKTRQCKTWSSCWSRWTSFSHWR